MKPLNPPTILRSTTRCTVQRKRGGIAITTVPGSIKAKIGIASRSNRSVIRGVGHRDIASRLRIAAVPQLRDRLAVGKRPAQRPAVDSRAARVVDDHIGSEAT